MQVQPIAHSARESWTGLGRTLELVRSESHLTSRRGAFFKGLSPDAMRDFESLETCFFCSSEVVLLRENLVASRVLFLLEGRVKLYINAGGGRRLNLRIAQPGEIIGLTSALSGDPSEVTAETVLPCRMTSLNGPEFIDFLTRHPASYRGVAQELSREYYRVCRQLRRIGFGSSAPARVSRLLELCVDAQTLKKAFVRNYHICPANPGSEPAKHVGLSLVPRKQPSHDIKDPVSVRES